MDSDDVDVIFENSVLHQALQETGMNNIETEPRKNNPKQGEHTHWDWRKKIYQAVQTIFSCLLLSGNPSNWWMLMSRIFVSSSSVESLNLTYQNLALTRLKSSALLSEDDKIFLELYIKEKDIPDVAREAFLGRKRRCVSKWKIYLFSVTMLSLAVVHALFGNESSPFLPILSSPAFPPLPQAVGILSVALVLLAFVPYCLVLSCVWSFIYIEEKLWLKMLQDIKEIDGQLKTFEKTSEELVMLTTKCLHFVKESELVAKGFLVARPTSNMDGSYFTSDPQHWCPRLRHLLFDVNSQLIEDVKETICKINKSIPLAPNLEVLDDTYLQHHGPYFELLRSFDGCNVAEDVAPQSAVNDDTQHIRQLKEFANNTISSPKLSALVLLFRLHLSYFIRGLVICFLKETLKDKRTNFCPAIVKSIMPLHESMNKFLGELIDVHAFYRAADGATKRNERGLMFSRGPKGPTEDLYRCVNSLDIRLHSVADRAERLRAELERKMDEESQKHEGSQDHCTGKISSSDKANYEEALRQIKVDLDLCVGCYEESLRKLDVRERQETCSPVSAEMSVNDTAPISMNQAKPAAVPLVDHVVVDEVFEAMIEGDEEEEEPQSIGSYRRFTQEERDQMRQHREDLKRFSHELHAVVGQRAIIQRQREEAALARVQDLSMVQQPSKQSSTSSLALAQERNATTSKSLLLNVTSDENGTSLLGGEISVQKSVILNSDVPVQSNNESNFSTPFSEVSKCKGDDSGGGGGTESHISSQNVLPNDDSQSSLASQNAEHQRLMPRNDSKMPLSERSSPELTSDSISQPNSILPVTQAIEREEISTNGNILPKSNSSNSSLSLSANSTSNSILLGSENIKEEKITPRVDISPETSISSPDLLAPLTNNQPNTVVSGTQKVKPQGFAMAGEILPAPNISSQGPPIQTNIQSNTVLHGTQSDGQPGTTGAGGKIEQKSDVLNSHDSILRNSNRQPNFSFPGKTALVNQNPPPSIGEKITKLKQKSDPDSTHLNQRLSHSVPSPTQTHSSDNQGSAGEGEKRHHSGNQAVESYSLLAVKLTSVENQKTSYEDMQELLPGARKKAEALNARRSASTLLAAGSPSRDDSWKSSSRRTRTPPPQPFVEGWRSSVQKSKDMHWATCVRVLEENRRAALASETEEPSVKETEELENEAATTNATKDNLDNSSFVIINGDEGDNEDGGDNEEEDLIFSAENINDIPPSTPTNAVGETVSQDTSIPLSSSTSTCHSQIVHPQPVNPEDEEFQQVDGDCVSRHNFTASGGDGPLNEALKKIESEDRGHALVNPNPNRRRHKAERVESRAWVNISHLDVTNKVGSHFTITREREMTNREVQLNQVPSPAPSSSFNTNLALMAAARAHSFHTSVEEHYVSDVDDSMTETLISSAVAGRPENRFGEGAVGGV